MQGIDWGAFRSVLTILAGYGLQTEADAGATPGPLARIRPAVAIANVTDAADGPRLRHRLLASPASPSRKAQR